MAGLNELPWPHPVRPRSVHTAHLRGKISEIGRHHRCCYDNRLSWRTDAHGKDSQGDCPHVSICFSEDMPLSAWLAASENRPHLKAHVFPGNELSRRKVGFHSCHAFLVERFRWHLWHREISCVSSACDRLGNYSMRMHEGDEGYCERGAQKPNAPPTILIPRRAVHAHFISNSSGKASTLPSPTKSTHDRRGE